MHGVRFDDTLETVLAGDLGTPVGVQSAWRQLVDLIGRRRVPPAERALATLDRIRANVPRPVREASARGLEYADPPAALVRLLVCDENAIALPVLRHARLSSADWITLLPDLSPAGRAVLRHRRDLSPAVRRALDAFGPIDFVLPAAEDPIELAVPEPEVPEAPPVVASAPEALLVDWTELPHGHIEVPMRSVPATAPAEPLPEWTGAASAPEPRPLSELIERLRAITGETRDPEAIEAAEREPAVVGPEPVEPEPAEPVVEAPVEKIAVEAVAEREPAALEEDLSFVALAGVAAALPLGGALGSAAGAALQSGTTVESAAPATVAPRLAPAQGQPMVAEDSQLAERTIEVGKALDVPAVPADSEGPFEIADVVARIDAFWRKQEEDPKGFSHAAPPRSLATDFRFETDARGLIRWVDGISRAPIIGLSLDFHGLPGSSRVDGVAAGAFRRRAGFSNARLRIEGESDAAGDWLISAIPVFDPANGRFTGYRGTARRPRVDERAEPSRPQPASTADSLRQLVHELRTPTNAIAGFAEMIESQMLGPVPDPYRDRAGTIREQARDLLGAIDDLDLAARIESDALSLVRGRVSLRPLLAGIADDLAQLAELRGSWIALPVDDLAIMGDRRAAERLLSRLMTTLISASSEGERIGVRSTIDGDMVAISIDRPAALADFPGEAMLGIDDEAGDASLLGTGFALRLARNLARELGGSLVIDVDSLTLRLPAPENIVVEQAHLN